MQLTGATAAQFDVNRLKTDIDYNIDSGTKVLNDKWNATPYIGDNDRAKLENWYYSIWAYNSFGSVNNPNSNSNPYQHRVISIIANCPNGQWQSCQITEPALSLIGNPPGNIANTPTPIHVDANYDGVIDGTNFTPPSISFNETNQGKWAGPNDIDKNIITFSLQDTGGGIGGLSQNWDSDPGGSSPQFPGSSGGYLKMRNVPDASRQGKHTAFIRAWNGNNSQSAVASSGWYGYDALPPTVAITSAQTQGSTYNTAQYITWHIDDPDSGIKSWAQGWDADPGNSQYTTSDGNLGLPVGTHTLHVHTVDNVGNEKDWTFGPYTYSPVTQVGQKSDSSIDQRFVDCYNRVGSGIVGNVLNNNFVHTAIGNGTGNGLAQDFIDGKGTNNIIIAKDGAAKAYDVGGNTWKWYLAQNYASSPAGFPTGDLGQVPVAVSPPGFDTPGTEQDFEGGQVYDSKYGTHLLPQSMITNMDVTTLVRVINGTYGFPVSDAKPAPTSPQGTSGSMISFEYGALYNTVKYGKYGVFRDIYTKYAAAGASAGWLGFPISVSYAWQGGTRQDFEGGYLTTGTAPTTHVLWNGTGGIVSIWNYSTADGSHTFQNYGPFAGWTAKAVADGGTDGRTRVLWDNADGRMSLWSLDNNAGTFTQNTFGPYGGWTATAVSVGSGNTTHVLWDNADGRMSLWNYSTTGGTFTQHTYGPYAGWTAQAVADGPDGRTRILWDNADGRMSLWSLNNSAASFSQNTFGPFSGWAAKAISVGADIATHVLWDNADGRIDLWSYSTADGTYTQDLYGPFSGWTAQALADGPDGRTRILWDNVNGMMDLWSLDGAGGGYTQYAFGPFAGWTAKAVSAGS